MRPRRIVVASQNPDKVREVEAVLQSVVPGIEIVRGLIWPEIEETEETLEGNAILKAEAVMRHTGLAALADDTGLEVAALGGKPGVRTARFAGPEATYEDNVSHLLEMLSDEPVRDAAFRTVVALVDPKGKRVVAHGELGGRIVHVARGEGGFGYDSVFEVDGRTLAEISKPEKNAKSHRALALRSLIGQVWGAPPRF